MTDDSGLIYPGHPDFDAILATSLPPGYQLGNDVVFLAEFGSGILKPGSIKEMNDYLYGGEYDLRMNEIGEEINELE